MIYFMRLDETGPVKIGWSKNPVARSFQVRPSPMVELTIIRLIDGAPWIEKWFHHEFDEFRLNGEWFTYDERMLTLIPPDEKPEIPHRKGPDTRDKQVMVRFSDLEYAALLGAATGADRKVADMARVLMLRGLDAPRAVTERGE